MLENKCIFGQMSPPTCLKVVSKKGGGAWRVFRTLCYVCTSTWPECNHAHHHSSRIELLFPRAVPMDRTPAMNSPTPLSLVPSILPVLWMGQNAVMAYAAMSYRAILQTGDVSLQYLSSVVTQ